MPHVYRLDAASASAADKAQSITRDEIAPRAAATDADRAFPSAQIAALAKHGLLGLTVDTAHGGLGLGPRAFCAVVEAIAEGCASTAMVYVMHVAALQAIQGSTTVAGKDALLREAATGQHLTTLAFSEKGSRSQFWAPVSQLVAEGDACVVSADKSWVTSANHAASYVSLSQKPGAANPGESTLYLVRPGHAGLEISAAGFDGLGLRGNDSAPVTLKGYRVPGGDLLSEQGKSEALVMGAVLPWFAIGTSSMAHGLCRAAFAATQKHLGAAGFAHTGPGLRDLPNLRARLAQRSVKTELSRSLLGHTLDHLEAPSEVTPLYVLQARYAALEASVEVTDLAMKACGGAAFSKHLAIERLFRDARAGWVMAPTADHLLDFVGRAFTGLPLFG